MTDGLKKWFRGRTRPRRGYRDRANGAAEVLEARQLLTSMLYLDCGAELATNSTGFQATVDEVKNVDGIGMHTARGTGPDMQTEVGLAGSEMLHFEALRYDWNRNGVTAEDADMQGMCLQVLELVNRSLEPYDIHAEVASSTSLHQVRQNLNANTGASSGEFDAYVFLGNVFYEQLPIDDDDGDDARKIRPGTGLGSQFGLQHVFRFPSFCGAVSKHRFRWSGRIPGLGRPDTRHSWNGSPGRFLQCGPQR